VSTDEAHWALVKGFERALHVQLREEALTTHERNLAEKLRKDKFSTEGWNLEGKLASESLTQDEAKNL
jgi:lipoate-protein ligase A